MEIVKRKHAVGSQSHKIEMAHTMPNAGYLSGISYFNVLSGSEICKNSFSAFITSRLKYLEGLKSLGDNWISGNSKQPTEESLKTSKSILSNLNWWYLTEGCNKYVHPQITMSPTPGGGIAMEITISKSVKALITVLDNNVDLEVENNGYYIEEVTDSNAINVSLSTLYTNAYRGQQYIRWGGTL